MTGLRHVEGDATAARAAAPPRRRGRAGRSAVRVDFSNGTLAVSSNRGFSFPRRGAVVVDVALPSGSRLQASVASASVTADGEYADCRLASASGDLALEAARGKVKADTASGDVTVALAMDSASVSTASGDVTLGELCGYAKFRTASGSLRVGRLQGDINAQTASGDVTVTAKLDGQGPDLRADRQR